MTRGAYGGRVAVLATMHGKEAAFGPILAGRLGVELTVPEGIDTDALGTFTGEVAREGSVEEAAMAKAALGLAFTGGDLALASEGAYGPHPQIPFMPFGVEVVAWVDHRIGLTLVEEVHDERPVYDHVELLWLPPVVQEVSDPIGVWPSANFFQASLYGISRSRGPSW
jgi:hypothetical protein